MTSDASRDPRRAVVAFIACYFASGCSSEKDWRGNWNTFELAYVVTDELGQPVPNADIEVFCWRSTWSEFGPASSGSQADDNGRVRRDLSRCSVVTIAADAPGRLSARAIQLDPKAKEQELVLRRAPTSDENSVVVSESVWLGVGGAGSPATGWSITSHQSAEASRSDVWVETDGIRCTLRVRDDWDGLHAIGLEAIKPASPYTMPLTAPGDGYSSTHTVEANDAVYFIRSSSPGTAVAARVIPLTRCTVEGPQDKHGLYVTIINDSTGQATAYEPESQMPMDTLLAQDMIALVFGTR